MGGLKPHFQVMAAYHRWANARLYEAVTQLSPEEFHAPRSGFFPSLAKTLNHLLVGDTIWMGRLTGAGSPGVTALNQVLHREFDALWAARQAMDRQIGDFVAALPESQFTEILAYRSTAGEAHRTPIDLVLTHFFNHGTHHRGQAHAMLSSTAVAPPSLDLIYFLRDHPELAQAGQPT